MDEPKPVNCGCGGEVWAFMTLYPENPERPYICQCRNCFTRTGGYPTEAEAITAWNRAMGGVAKNATSERTAKIGKQGINLYCLECGAFVHAHAHYCHGCGARLEWE